MIKKNFKRNKKRKSYTTNSLGSESETSFPSLPPPPSTDSLPEYIVIDNAAMNLIPSLSQTIITTSIESSTDGTCASSFSSVYSSSRTRNRRQREKRTLRLNNNTDRSSQPDNNNCNSSEELSYHEDLISRMNTARIDLNHSSATSNASKGDNLIRNDDDECTLSSPHHIEGLDDELFLKEAASRANKKVDDENNQGEIIEKKPPIDDIIVKSSSRALKESPLLAMKEEGFVSSYDDDYHSHSNMSRLTSDDSHFEKKKQQQCQLLPLTVENNVLNTSNIPTNSGKLPRQKRRVNFGTISIRYYNRILTENPSTVLGPSIGIGWKYYDPYTRPIPLLDYERRDKKSLLLRPAHHLVLNREQREEMLLDLGYSQKELAISIRNNTRTRNQRRQTVQNLGAQRMEELIQNAGERFKKLFSRR